MQAGRLRAAACPPKPWFAGNLHDICMAYQLLTTCWLASKTYERFACVCSLVPFTPYQAVVLERQEIVRTAYRREKGYIDFRTFDRMLAFRQAPSTAYPAGKHLTSMVSQRSQHSSPTASSTTLSVPPDDIIIFFLFAPSSHLPFPRKISHPPTLGNSSVQTLHRRSAYTASHACTHRCICPSVAALALGVTF